MVPWWWQMWVNSHLDIVHVYVFFAALKTILLYFATPALQHVITITGTMHGSQQQMHEVQNTLGNLGIHLTNEEFQQIVDAIDIECEFCSLGDSVCILIQCHQSLLCHKENIVGWIQPLWVGISQIWNACIEINGT